MRPSRRSLLLGLAAGLTGAGLVAGPALSRPRMAGTDPEAIEVRARPITSLSASGGERRFGSLLFRGGLTLSSSHPVFGGFSGLSLSEDGERILAVSDSAHWLTARLERQGGTPSRLVEAVLAPMLDASGRPLSRTRSFDTESLSLHRGIAHVGIERSDEILRFDWAGRGMAARGQRVALPREARGLPRNRGYEALGVAPGGGGLAAGSIVALAERSGAHDEPTLGVIIGGRQPGLFRYRLLDGFEVTDLAFLPGGDMLVLERWYRPWRGVGMRLRRVAGASIGPGAMVEGRLLVDLDLSHEIDNMEALAVHREAGRTILTIMSDDNYSALQRTILLEFELAE